MSALRVEDLTSESFGPFGSAVTRPTESPHATGPGWRWWAETVRFEGDERPWAVGYLDLEPAEFRFDWAERHLATPEVVLATTRDLVVYVAPAGNPDEPPLADFHAFRISPGAGIVMDPGVWHGAPFVEGGRSAALVLLLEGTGRDDVKVVRFPDIEILDTRAKE